MSIHSRKSKSREDSDLCSFNKCVKQEGCQSSSGKLRRRCLQTDSYQIAKEKPRQFESARLRGIENPLLTRTPIADVVTTYVAHMRQHKTPKNTPDPMRPKDLYTTALKYKMNFTHLLEAIYDSIPFVHNLSQPSLLNQQLE